MSDSKKVVYFISDAHLGAPGPVASLAREKRLVEFLEEIKGTASDLFIMGDLFDFWFEYKHVVPRGFTRILGKLAELSDLGIKIHYFTGNHDIWNFSYLQEETGIILYNNPTAMTIGGKQFFLAHGDGLDESDPTFRFVKSIFTNRFLQWAFARLHPNLAFSIAQKWSRRSRARHTDDCFHGESEPIIGYARKHLLNEGYDFLVFGHRHIPVDYQLSPHTRLIILGDWISNFSYAVFTEGKLELKTKD
ncbi:MAG: UDP-2,3-diacylglucosamine diphosphatase [Bacteroidota bacterium]